MKSRTWPGSSSSGFSSGMDSSLGSWGRALTARSRTANIPHMRKVHMLATGAYLPGDPIDNEQLEQLAGPLPDAVIEGIQVKTRHWIADTTTGEQQESNSEMAYKAA